MSVNFHAVKRTLFREGMSADEAEHSIAIAQQLVDEILRNDPRYVSELEKNEAVRAKATAALRRGEWLNRAFFLMCLSAALAGAGLGARQADNQWRRAAVEQGLVNPDTGEWKYRVTKSLGDGGIVQHAIEVIQPEWQ